MSWLMAQCPRCSIIVALVLRGVCDLTTCVLPQKVRMWRITTGHGEIVKVEYVVSTAISVVGGMARLGIRAGVIALA
jgi:hypothetical protein